MQAEAPVGGGKYLFREAPVPPDFIVQQETYDFIRKTSWVIAAWEFGNDKQFLPARVANFCLIKYILRPIVRFIYAIGTAILLGVIGTLYNLAAAAWYQCKGKHALAGAHLRGASNDASALLSMALVVGEIAAFEYACKPRNSIREMLCVSQFFRDIAKCICCCKNDFGLSKDEGGPSSTKHLWQEEV